MLDLCGANARCTAANCHCLSQPLSSAGVGGQEALGKTSTREMIALALSAEKNVMQTKGNSNSQIGLPLTMFQFEKEHTAAVIEMGISEFGEMERLVLYCTTQLRGGNEHWYCAYRAAENQRTYYA